MLIVSTAHSNVPLGKTPKIPEGVPGGILLEAPADIAGKGKSEELPPIWQKSLSTALIMAGMEYRPVFLFFHSPECPWCARLKELFEDKDIESVLKHFILVECDVNKDPATAHNYQVQGVPLILFISGDGRIRGAVQGFTTKDELLSAIRSVISNQIQVRKDKESLMLISKLDQNSFPDERWPDLILLIGDRADGKEEIVKRIMKLSPFPKEKIVALLEHRLLAVRTGAIEILEEIVGDEFSYDPWRSREENADTIARWKEWAANKDPVSTDRHSPLTKEKCDRLLNEIISDNKDRYSRALRSLEDCGDGCIAAIDEFIASHGSLSEGAKNRLKEVKYMTILSDTAGIDPGPLAHQLLSGSLDNRLRAVLELKKAGLRGVPILKDFLEHPEPVLRETAIDTIVDTGGRMAAHIIENHIASEKDSDVLFSILKSLGKLKTKTSAKILASFLSNGNEDLAVIALKGLADIRAASMIDQIAGCLDDPRWRVKVAALEAITELGDKGKSALTKSAVARTKIESLMNDSDEYVRFKSVLALAHFTSGGTMRKLEEAFMKDDSIKGAVISSYGSRDLCIPDKFVKGLVGKDSAVLLTVVRALDKCDEKQLHLAKFLAANTNPDISVPAAAFIAKNGFSDPDSIALMAELLKNGKREAVLAVLKNLKIPDSNSRSSDYRNVLEELSFASSSEGSSDSANSSIPPGTSKDLEDLFAAFESGVDTAKPAKTGSRVEIPASAKPAPPAETISEQKEKPPDLNDIFEAFGDSPTPTASSGKADKPGRISQNDFFSEIKKLAMESDDEELKFAAALVMIRKGDEEILPLMENLFPSQTEELRAEIVDSADSGTLAAGKFLLKALSDPSMQVRKNAAAGLLKSKHPEQLAEFLNSIGRPDSKLKIYELDWTRISLGNHYDTSVKDKKLRAVLRSWAINTVKNNPDPSFKDAALFVIGMTWAKDDGKIVSEYFSSENVWLRRAAYYTLSNSLDAFILQIPDMLKDKSDRIRELIPAIASAKYGESSRYSSESVFFFDEKNFFRNYNYANIRSYSSRRPKMNPAVRDALFMLTSDESMKIRLDSFLALLDAREPLDLRELIRTANSFPDQKTISSKITNFIEKNYKSLGRNFEVLLSYLDEESVSPEDLAKIYKHFNVDSESLSSSLDFKAFYRKSDPVEAEFILSAEALAEPALEKMENPLIVYFDKPGCSDCTRVKKILREMKELFPDLEIETYNISKVDAMRLNEAYSENAGTPTSTRLVAPSVFSGKGYLVKSQIDYDGIRRLLSESAPLPRTSWRISPASAEIFRNDTKLAERFSNITWLVVASGGFWDGLNPCAFAAMIFFISYLRIARRSPAEIAHVGMAFVAGVFIAYYLLGLGISEIIYHISFYENVKTWFDRAMIAMVFILFVMSVYDGVMSARGRTEDISLQLPERLKEKIRTTIRIGARHRRFISAAFVTGLTISFLEFACTGQVYLPVIQYMLESGGKKLAALYYLLVYNVAFVLPLVIVFIIAFSGMKNEKLVDLMRKNAAIVKFATALLFLLILVFLISQNKFMIASIFRLN